MNEIRVVHINKSKKTAQYLGRAMPVRGLSGSPLGNPFRLKTGEARGSTIARYQLWLEEKLEQRDPDVRTAMNRLFELALDDDLELACWCAPLPCHCDVVKAKLEAALSRHGAQNAAPAFG